LSNLIKLEQGQQAALPHNALVLEREAARVHRVSREEDKAALEARVRHECEVMYTKQIAAAYQKGYEAGAVEAQSAGTAENEAIRAELLTRSGELLNAIGDQHNHLRSAVETTVIDLALEISTRIVKREVELESPVLAQIREAIKRILGVEKVKMKINKADEDLVRSHKTDLHQAADSVKEFVLDADDKISVGSCILESELGNVDARIETQMKQIETAMREHSRGR
jgi:flagellar assembly protein FliH